MPEVKVQSYVHTAWWLRFYVYGMAFTATLMRTEPDWDKVQRVVAKAITVRFR